MAYKYYNIISPVGGSSISASSVNTDWKNSFYSVLDDQFSLASSYYIIQEESVFGSGGLSDVGVRVNTAKDPNTGIILGDDFKSILFDSKHTPVTMGQKFYFDSSYWITYNTSSIKSLANTCIVRRCNNVLRWVDANGNYYSEPCSIDYPVKNVPDRFSQLIMPDSAYITIFAQANSRTKKIKANQRFLFGNVDNWQAFKIYGMGARNFLNQSTTDNDSVQLLELFAERNYDNSSNDDLILGIANKYNLNYALAFDPIVINGNAGESYRIEATATFNGNPITKATSYTTSGSNIATVSGSGLVTLVSSGSCIITGCLVDNSSASAVCNVTVSASAVSNNEIRVSPTPDYILEGESQTYDVRLYLDGVLQSDTFGFLISGSSAPSLDYYSLEIVDGNSFKVTNKQYYLNNPLDILCQSGVYSKIISIYLRGAW